MNFTIEQLFNDFNAKYLEEAKSKGIDLGLQTVFTPIDKIEKATGFRFADHITADTKTVAVLFNTEFIDYFIKELPQDYINNIKFTFFYDCEFDHVQVQDCVFFSGKNPNIEMISIENIKDLDKVMAGKKFNIVFSNPPYDRSLHLKVINECSNICENIVWISPIRWLQDPLGKYKKVSDYKRYNESLASHIKYLKIIDSVNAASLFDSEFMFDLGIYYWNKNFKNQNPTNLTIHSHVQNIIEKVIGKTTTSLNDKTEQNKIDGWRVRISEMKPVATNRSNDGVNAMKYDLCHYKLSWVYFNGFQNSVHWSQNKLPGAGNKAFTINDSLPFSIHFNSEEEAKNFEMSTKTIFYRWLMLTMKTDMHVPLKFLPYMNNYLKEWTNEDFYQFFGITEEEQKYIEETMAQFN
jgi:hypothetical protein